MSVYRKLKKLVRSPGAFFDDAKRNRKSLPPAAPASNKAAAKPAAPAPAPKPVASAPAPKPASPPKPPAPATPPKPPAPAAPPKPAIPPKPTGFAINFPRSELPAIRFVLHAGDGLGSEYQFLNWLTEVQQAYAQFAVVIRSWDVYARVKDTLPACNLIYASSATEVEAVITRMRSLRLVLYVSNTGNNLHFLRYNHLVHAFIGHGDSEKSASCHKFFRAYDEIWVSGQAHIDRFANAEFDARHVSFVRVGRSALRQQLAATQLKIAASALHAPEKVSESSSSSRNVPAIASEVSPEVASDIVNPAAPALELPQPLRSHFLYLPTWEGAFDDSSYTSLDHTYKILQELCEADGHKGAVKFHPMTGKRIVAFATFESRLHARFDQERVYVMPRAASHTDAYDKVDFLIADISSVITDFLVTLKPIFVYWPGFKNLVMAESKFSIKDYCYVYSTIDELRSLVNQVMVEGNDRLYDMRKAALNYYIDLEATERGAFQKEILRACVDARVPGNLLIAA